MLPTLNKDTIVKAIKEDPKTMKELASWMNEYARIYDPRQLKFEDTIDLAAKKIEGSLALNPEKYGPSPLDGVRLFDYQIEAIKQLNDKTLLEQMIGVDYSSGKSKSYTTYIGVKVDKVEYMPLEPPKTRYEPINEPLQAYWVDGPPRRNENQRYREYRDIPSSSVDVYDNPSVFIDGVPLDGFKEVKIIIERTMSGAQYAQVSIGTSIGYGDRLRGTMPPVLVRQPPKQVIEQPQQERLVAF